MDGIKVITQGRAIVEETEDGEFLVMTPDGFVRVALTKTAAFAIAEAWFLAHAAKDGLVMSIGVTEER